MGERGRNREIVDRLAARVKQHEAVQGRSITGDKAHAQAAQVARVRDQQRAEGLHVNKAKGVASGRIREKQAQERAAQARESRPTGRITIDLGRGRK